MENLCKVNINELIRITQDAIIAHPEREKIIMKDFSKICRRNGKYTELDILFDGFNNKEGEQK